MLKLSQMRTKQRLVLAAALAWIGTASAQSLAIDTRKSLMTVKVDKAGVFSAFAHNHEIVAPIAGGAVDTAARRGELHVRASSLRVQDPKASGKDRDEIQKTML